MTKKKIAMLFLLLFLIPFQVEAEDTEQEHNRSGLLSNTVNNLLGTTEELVESVQETVTEVEKVVPVLKPVTNTVSEVEKVTLPVVHDVVTGVTETTDTALESVVDGVDKAVQILPEVPVVTPILNKTTETLDEVTSEVQTIVDSGEQAVENIVNIVVEEEQKPVIKQEIKPETKPTTHRSPRDAAEDSNSSSLSEVEPLPVIEVLIKETPIVEVAEKPAEENVTETTVVEELTPVQPIIDTVKLEKKKESSSVSMKVKDNESIYNRQPTDLEEKVVKDQTTKVPAIPAIPLGPEPKMVIISGAAWNGQTNASSGGLSLLNSGNDVLQGFLPSNEMLKELTKKKWYHKNSYAIVQWIHTPLRKPPELTPFLYVI